MGTILRREGHAASTATVMRKQNKDDGFACVSCAWAKPSPPHVFEFCENGAKATAWDLTSNRVASDFFASHTVTELESWSDFELEQAGRLTEPMRWDAASDRYVPVDWDEAFAGIAAHLRAMDPKAAVFYSSGRACNEASYMWQLMVRMYGCNNLPDSSNMCHESTSVALPEGIGVPVGTVTLEDFEHADAVLIIGQNTPTNSPRMLHQLDELAKREVPIIVINPLRETGLERFTNPQNVAQMATGTSRRIQSRYLQVKAGGDLALLVGVCKTLVALDADDREAGGAGVLDWAFIHDHTSGFEAFSAALGKFGWTEIEERSGVTRAEIAHVATICTKAKALIGIYGMGLTQHRMGVENVRMLLNLMLLGGHIGRKGAGICPVRGHSNVQGQRAVWITEKPELAPLDKFAEMFGFDPPRGKGRDTVEAAQGVVDGSVRAVLQLGGNLVRSMPDHSILVPAWRNLELTVMITTKLNRSHLVHGRAAYLLPCLSRIEIDRQTSGPQVVSVEDSTAFIHASRGMREPASAQLRSEPAIIAGLATALLPPNPKLDWQAWAGNYELVRDAIAASEPKWYAGYGKRMWEPGGFHRPNPARDRVWQTPTKKANFLALENLDADPDVAKPGEGVFNLVTIRSNDQFNTTVYGYDDRFRGIHGSRDVVMMNAADMNALGVAAGDHVALQTVADDGVLRRIEKLQVVPFDLAPGTIAGYYPECNSLLPLWHHARKSHVPAAKSIPVRIEPSL